MMLLIIIASILISIHCSPLPQESISVFNEYGSRTSQNLKNFNSELPLEGNEYALSNSAVNLSEDSPEEVLEAAENGVVFRPLFAYRKLYKKKATIQKDKIKNYQQRYPNIVFVPVTLY